VNCSSFAMDSVIQRVKSFTGQQQDDVLPIEVPANTHKSIRKLMAGNDRYVRNASQTVQEKQLNEHQLRRRLSTLGQAPWAIMVSCSDSRCPVERVFDASPGDLFVVRVAGNICGSPIGGVIGSAEYGVEHLKSPVIMVLGHTKCGAVSAAVRCSKDCIAPGDHFGRNLGAVVGHIRTPALEALETSERPSTPEQIEHAIQLNVYHSMEQILRWSTVIQETVRQGELEIHGGIYDITTGKVTFLGQHPRQRELLDIARSVTVRTGADAPMPAPEALLRLQKGNSRYVIGDVDHKIVDTKVRHALVQKGQRPLAAMLGCADSRIPIDYVFDTNPGDLFVVRNAGSTCGAIAGGIIGSLEYGVGHLKTQLLVVLGHTQCGAVAAAMEAHLTSDKKGEEVPEGLRCLLERLHPPVKMAVEQSDSTAMGDRVSLAIELNVWHTIEQLLESSTVLHGAVTQGILQIHGAIYDLQTGRVRFMGEHPKLKQLVHKDIDSMDITTPDGDWKRDTTCGSQSTAASSKRTHSKQVAAFDPVGIVPDPGQKTPAAWGNDGGAPGQKKSDADDDGKCFELSWYVQTKHGRQHLKDVILDQNNWIAGVTVALVSVPLSISLGIASGTTPIRGVATAIFGGLCAGIFGSSDYNIVGPAGALSGMLMSYVVQYGEDVLPWLSLISAVICALCALLRLDTYMLLMPKSVFEGFTVGVALIIGLNQINFACGLMPGKKHALFVMNIVESIKTLGETRPTSLIVFALQAPALWFLMRKLPKIPWTVILPVVSIPLGVLCDGGHLGFDLLTLKSKYGVLEPEIVQPLRPCDATFLDMLIPSFSIAIVAVLETLISAKIASDRVDREFSELGELRGLVISHAVCGFTGAMPPTGVFVRTSLNTSLGATHRFSQTLNAIVVALITLALMPIFSYLPQATIAAILVVAAVRMTPFSYLKKLWAQDKGALALCLVTALICVGEDPVIGLAAGMVMALLAGAKTQLSAPFVDIKSKPSGDKKAYHIAIQGAVTYVNAETFLERARKLENASEISVDLSGVRQMDHDGITFLGKVADGWVRSEPDCRVWIKGVHSKIYPSLSKFSWFEKAEGQGRVQMA